MYKMSKLSRQIAEAHVIKRKLGASGVTVVSMTEPTSAERLFEGIIQIVDDFVKERHGEDARLGIVHLRQRQDS